MSQEPSPNEAKLFAEFENAGEAEVCRLRNWLKQKQDTLDEGGAAVEADQVEIARLAKDAAWEAVEAAKASIDTAREANKRAMIAIALSMLSLITTIGIWLSHR
jgi:hypothetical protein